MPRNPLPRRNPRPRRPRGYCRLGLERLEDRCVPALVLGNVLKETFDDPASFTAFVSGRLPGNSFDDIGRVTTIDPATGAVSYQMTHPVFHHQFTVPGHASLLGFGGTTAPAAPQDR